MKPGFKLCLVIFITATLSYSSFAQDVSLNHQNGYTIPGLYGSSSISANSKEDNSAALSTLKSYSPKAYKNFTKVYKNSTDVHVSQENGETFIYCRVDSIINRIGYDKRGNWHHMIRYYDGNKLNKSMSHMILDSYKGFELKNVTEVTISGELAYFVTIESMRSWKILRLQNDEMDEMNTFQK